MRKLILFSIFASVAFAQQGVQPGSFGGSSVKSCTGSMVLQTPTTCITPSGTGSPPNFTVLTSPGSSVALTATSSNSDSWRILLNANTTATLSGATIGETLGIMVCEPASGGPFTYTGPTGFPLTIIQLAGYCTSQQATWNGSTINVPTTSSITDINGNAIGAGLFMQNTTSGTTNLLPPATGSPSITLPGVTGTLLGDAGTGFLQAAAFPALTGDGTTTAGSLVFTLATVNGSPGVCGSATTSCVQTTNGKGLTTAQSSTTIAPPFSAITGSPSVAQVFGSFTGCTGTMGPGADGTCHTFGSSITAVSGNVVTGTGASIADSGTAIASLAPLASPTFTGTATIPTLTVSTAATIPNFLGNVIAAGSWQMTVATAALQNSIYVVAGYVPAASAVGSGWQGAYSATTPYSNPKSVCQVVGSGGVSYMSIADNPLVAGNSAAPGNTAFWFAIPGSNGTSAWNPSAIECAWYDAQANSASVTPVIDAGRQQATTSYGLHASASSAGHGALLIGSAMAANGTPTCNIKAVQDMPDIPRIADAIVTFPEYNASGLRTGLGMRDCSLLGNNGGTSTIHARHGLSVYGSHSYTISNVYVTATSGRAVIIGSQNATSGSFANGYEADISHLKIDYQGNSAGANAHFTPFSATTLGTFIQGNYISGLSATGTGTCTLNLTGGTGTGAQAIVTVTGTNAFTTAMTVGAAGSGYGATGPTTASVASFTSTTCSGTATVSTVIGGSIDGNRAINGTGSDTYKLKPYFGSVVSASYNSAGSTLTGCSGAAAISTITLALTGGNNNSTATLYLTGTGAVANGTVAVMTLKGDGYDQNATTMPTTITGGTSGCSGTVLLNVTVLSSVVVTGNGTSPGVGVTTLNGTANRLPCLTMPQVSAGPGGIGGSAGAWTLVNGITLTGSVGCSGTIYITAQDLAQTDYGFFMAAHTDSDIDKIVVSNVPTGVDTQNGSNRFTKIHPFTVNTCVEDGSQGNHWNLIEFDTCGQYFAKITNINSTFSNFEVTNADTTGLGGWGGFWCTGSCVSFTATNGSVGTNKMIAAGYFLAYINDQSVFTSGNTQTLGQLAPQSRIDNVVDMTTGINRKNYLGSTVEVGVQANFLGDAPSLSTTTGNAAINLGSGVSGTSAFWCGASCRVYSGYASGGAGAFFGPNLTLWNSSPATSGLNTGSSLTADFQYWTGSASATAGHRLNTQASNQVYATGGNIVLASDFLDYALVGTLTTIPLQTYSSLAAGNLGIQHGLRFPGFGTANSTNVLPSLIIDFGSTIFSGSSTSVQDDWQLQVQPRTDSSYSAFSFAHNILNSGTYTSGITATGATNTTCILSGFNGNGYLATGTVALTGNGVIASGTPILWTDPGYGYNASVTSAAVATGTATSCTGTAVVAVTPNGILGAAGVVVPALNIPELPLYSTSMTNQDVLQADSQTHEFQAATAGTSTYGMVHRSQAAVDTGTHTTGISTATLCAASNGSCGQSGLYTIEWAFVQNGTACGTPGTGGVTLLLTWTDSNGTAHSAVSLPMDDATSLVATSGTFHFQSTNAAAWASGNFNVYSNGSIIQYATGYASCGVGTGSYVLKITVTRKS